MLARRRGAMTRGFQSLPRVRLLRARNAKRRAANAEAATRSTPSCLSAHHSRAGRARAIRIPANPVCGARRAGKRFHCEGNVETRDSERFLGRHHDARDRRAPPSLLFCGRGCGHRCSHSRRGIPAGAGMLGGAFAPAATREFARPPATRCCSVLFPTRLQEPAEARQAWRRSRPS